MAARKIEEARTALRAARGGELSSRLLTPRGAAGDGGAAAGCGGGGGGVIQRELGGVAAATVAAAAAATAAALSEEAGRSDGQGTEAARGDKQGTEAEALWPEALRGLARELPSLGSVLRALPMEHASQARQGDARQPAAPLLYTLQLSEVELIHANPNPLPQP